MTAGESHGPGLTVIVEGLPAGVPVDRSRLDSDLRRRQGGYGRGGRMKIETDTVEILSGLRHGRTLGSPVSLVVRNKDHENWKDVMSPDPVPAETKPRRVLKYPRPGHADLAGALKYLTDDLRNVLGVRLEPVVLRLRPRAVAVAAQIEGDAAVAVGQVRNDEIPPMRMCRSTVQEEDRWLRRGPPIEIVQADAVGIEKPIAARRARGLGSRCEDRSLAHPSPASDPPSPAARSHSSGVSVRKASAWIVERIASPSSAYTARWRASRL